MLKKSITLILITILSLFILVGCSSELNEESIGKEPTDGQQEVYPIVITDGTGEEIKIASEPKRIISLIPSLTESLFAIGAGDNVIAVTIHDTYPENVKDNVSYVFEDPLNPNIEQIINLKPDLIVVGAYNDQLTEKLKSFQIPVAKFDPQNIEEIYQTIEKLGILTNTKNKAQQVIKDMREREENIVKIAEKIDENERVSVFVEVSSDLWTAGNGTFIDELITKAGGKNIVNEEGWIQFSEEKILSNNPDIIISTYGDYDSSSIQNIMNREGWQSINAVQNKRVVNVNSDIISRSGPRMIDGLERIAAILYPNVFDKPTGN